MSHRPASSPAPPAGRSIPRARRMIITCGGMAVFLAAASVLAPAASATPPPPEPSVAPVPSPPPLAPAPAHFPLWAIAAMVAATVVLSAASTLITLSLEYMRRDRRKPAAAGHRRIPDRLVLPAAVRHLRRARAATERQHLTTVTYPIDDPHSSGTAAAPACRSAPGPHPVHSGPCLPTG
jgi:hypothetical protein